MSGERGVIHIFYLVYTSAATKSRLGLQQYVQHRTVADLIFFMTGAASFLTLVRLQEYVVHGGIDTHARYTCATSVPWMK